MKSILSSIRPKWVAKIFNGEKTIEIRKKFPKDYVGWVYMYCSKSNTQYLVGSKTQKCEIITKSANARFSPNIDKYTGNGKVVARFWCDKVEEINRYCTGRGISYKTETLNNIELCDKSCLDLIEIDHYLYFKKGFAIHISKLEIFDKPKELSEFKSCKKNIVNTKINGMVFETELDNSLIKAPQSWCYCEVGE